MGQPALMTLVLAWLFVVFAAYGLSGAGGDPAPALGGQRAAAAFTPCRGLSILGQIAQLVGSGDEGTPT